jgi:hypothetical protein
VLLLCFSLDADDFSLPSTNPWRGVLCAVLDVHLIMQPVAETRHLQYFTGFDYCGNSEGSRKTAAGCALQTVKTLRVAPAAVGGKQFLIIYMN